MAKRPTLSNITSLTNSSGVNAINSNWDSIQEAFDNTLSLDGSTPNAMNADLDLNGNALLNVGSIAADNLTLDGQVVTDISAVPEWRGAWLTATDYAKRDMVKTGGNVYICLIAHTSGTFSTDLTNLNWELMVSKGDSGAGTGDLLSTNNLSDLANAATARSNLGLGTVATESTVPVAKGGTGATDAGTALTNLGAQAADDTLTSLSGLSLVQGDILYATAADTLQRLAKGTASQVLQINSGATAPEWVDNEWWGVLQSAYVLTSTTSQQKLFNWSTNGALTLPTGTYRFDCGFTVTGMSATSGNAAFGILGAGTATLATIRYYGKTADSSGFPATSDIFTSTSANAPAGVATGSTATALAANFTGVFDVTVTGTLIPSITLTTAAAASVGAGSYFRVRRLGPTATATVGPWS